MTSIGIVVREGSEPAFESARQLVAWARLHAYEVVAEEGCAKALGCRALEAESLVKQVAIVVTLGGDGTLIGIARYSGDKGPAIIGVNFGNLGFLTEISPEELIPTIEAVLSGSAAITERPMLHAQVFRAGRSIFTSQAVNDAVVQKGATDCLLELDLAVNGEAVMRLRADGLIVATPTGSTAYSLAAGGAIVSPTLPAVLITPICPHSLTTRPLVLELSSRIEIAVPPYDGSVSLTIDGQVSERLQSGDIVSITRAANVVRVARSPKKSSFEILRAKLNWGIANSVG